MNGAPFRRRWRFMVTLLLLVLPTCVYWETITERYGFRDDYPTLREAEEDPANILRFIGSQGRPFYASLIIHSFRPIETVAELSFLRLLSAGLLGALGAAFFHSLVRHRWDWPTAALTAGILVLLPGSQVIVAWAVAWPHAFTMLLATAAFVAAECAEPERRVYPRIAWLAAAIALMATSLLIYPVSALFYLVLFAGAFIDRRDGTPGRTATWGGRHALLMIAGAVIAGGLAMAWMTYHDLTVTGRASPEDDLGAKFAWFVSEPLRDALALIILNDRPEGAPKLVTLTALIIATALAAGAVKRFLRQGVARGMLWLLALMTLPPAAYIGSLIADERLNAYRTALPMTGILLIFLAASLRELVGRRPTTGILIVLFLTAIPLARRQPLELFAQAQQEELAIIEDAARKLLPEESPWQVYAHPAERAHDAYPRRHADEFGSLSADGGWIVREMLLRAVHDLYPESPPVTELIEGDPPSGRTEDAIVIDMRRLREQRVKTSDR